EAQKETLKSTVLVTDSQPSYIQAFGIGVAQALAVIPGVSRSAATIIAGRLFGLSKSTALEFSFLLALPTIATAAGYDAFKNPAVFEGNLHILIIGFTISFLTAILAIKFLLAFVKNHSFISFGVYRIILAVFILFLIL
ncbi:MAG: undecaprenyl-diphosphate phosphatase, partial [Patescibacteria group bacterium]